MDHEMELTRNGSSNCTLSSSDETRGSALSGASSTTDDASGTVGRFGNTIDKTADSIAPITLETKSVL